MATYNDVDQRALELLNFPDIEDPSKEVRLSLQLTIVDTYAKEITRSGKPALVDNFTTSFSGSETERSIPRDDFEGLFHAVDVATGQPIQVFNFADAALYGVAGAQGSGAGGRICALGWRGVGDEKRLMAYPSGASGDVQVWYLVGIDQNPALTSQVNLLDQFHLGLVPLALSLAGMPYWKWRGLSEAQTDKRKAMYLDPRNPLSLVGMHADQKRLFLERVYNPDVKRPSRALKSVGARRHLQRQFGPPGF